MDFHSYELCIVNKSCRAAASDGSVHRNGKWDTHAHMEVDGVELEFARQFDVLDVRVSGRRA